MIELPEEDWSDPEVLADWIELNAVLDGFSVRGGILDQLKDSALWGDGERAGQTAQVPHAQAVADAWAILRIRHSKLADAWPFAINSNRLSWRQSTVYQVLLLADIGRKYRVAVRPAVDGIRSLFEDIVAASLGVLLGGRVCRFGVPFPRGWPSAFPLRVSRLAQSFGLDCRERDIPRLSSRQQQDDGLDVLGRMKLGDEEAATLYLLVQCATGANWKNKRGEPSLAKWQKYVDWDATTVRALAVPWALRPRSALKRIHLDFDAAIILDRWRIVSGKPDEVLGREHHRRLKAWVRAQLAAFRRT